MPALQLHCPHCGGLFQIDESLSGQHVGCPLCANVVAIPALAPPASGYGPPPPAPPDFAPPAAGDETFQLGCPTCGGPFQVTREMSGQQIACPHCHSAVLLPDFAPASSATAASWEDFTSLPAPATDYHPQASVAPPAISEPAPSRVERSMPSPAQPFPPQPSAGLEEMLPPSVESRRAARPVPVSKQETAPDLEQELPPAAKKKKPRGQTRPASNEKPHEEDLLPPAARADRSAPKKDESQQEELLPPAARRSKTKEAPERETPTEEPVRRHRRPGEAADGSVLIPTEEGGFVALREPIKTVSGGGREVELRRLTPEEKESRRFKRNLFVAIFGMIFLIVFLLVAAYLRGP